MKLRDPMGLVITGPNRIKLLRGRPWPMDFSDFLEWAGVVSVLSPFLFLLSTLHKLL